MSTCAAENCKEGKRFVCGGCNAAWYCSAACQRGDWQRHRGACTRTAGKPAALAAADARPAPRAAPPAAAPADQGGYPTETMVRLHDAAVYASLAAPSKEEERKLEKKGGALVLRAHTRAQAKLLRPIDVSHVAVDRATFAEQFRLFTGGLFDEWDGSLWEGMLAAGGAVLGSLLPLPANFQSLVSAGGDYMVHDFRQQRLIGASLERTSRAAFLGRHRWPGADVDLFIHGLAAEDAAAKLRAVLTALRRAALRIAGPKTDVVFIKTPNTVTFRCPPLFRDVQVITRLYADEASILNSFDIDCCGFGYDGQRALGVGRALRSLRSKVNPVNLSIRGEAYETRLLKYAERGWAIGVAELQRAKVARGLLAFELDACGYSRELEPTSQSWAKWSGTRFLDRLLLVESWADKVGGRLIGYPFPGRLRGASSAESATEHGPAPNVFLNGVGDSYPGGGGKGRQTPYPATTDLSRITSAAPSYSWRVHWQLGNMPRKPMSWEEWAGPALEGGYKPARSWDYAEFKRAREEREAKAEAERKVAAAAAAAARAAELQQARDEAARQADALRVSAEARAQAAHAAAAERDAEIERMRAEQLAAETKARQMRETLDALSRENGVLADAAEGILCCVCLEAARTMMVEPCNHLCLCAPCGERVGDKCPFCRSPISAVKRVFT